MNLNKIAKLELLWGFIFLIPPIIFLFFPYTRNTAGSFTILTGTLVFSFGRIFSYKNKLMLDEREWNILNKAGSTAAFMLIFIMILFYLFGGYIKTFGGTVLNDYWAFYMCPVFLLSHAFTVLILNNLEVKT